MMDFLNIIISLINFGCSEANIQEPASRSIQSPVCFPRFDYKGGWLGADAAYSIAVSKQTSIWFFGDTFVGEAKQKSRTSATQIANSVGILRCNQITFVWQGQATKEAIPVFETKIKDTRYWPMDGFEHNNNLYLALVEVQNLDNTALGFEFNKVVLAKISNFLDEIDNWKIEFLDLMPTKGLLTGISMVKQDKHVLLFTLVDRLEDKYAKRPVILARILLDKLDHPQENLEYLTKDMLWKPEFQKTNARIIFEDGMTEMSIRYHTNKKKWIAITHHPNFPSQRIVLSTASSLEGTWSPWKTIYMTPEMTPGSAEYDPDTFCYAGKEQAQFTNEDNLVITYACNSFNPEKQILNMNLYRPQVVQIPWNSFTLPDRTLE